MKSLPYVGLSCLGGVASVLVGAGVLMTAPAWADASYQLTPSRLVLEPSGGRSAGSFQVRSTGNEPVAIEVRVTDRQMDPQGNETQTDAEDDFVVYPPQIVLQPGQVQTVRVTWLGDPNVAVEQAFRLITEQLPIDLGGPEETPTGVTVRINALYRYVAALYVTPPGAQPNVVIRQASHQRIDGQDKLLLEFDNQGTAHQLLSGLNLTLAPVNQPEASLTLRPDQLIGINGENVLAQHQRQFVMPWPEGLPVGPITASFELR